MQQPPESVERAICQLGEEFPKLHWNFLPDPASGPDELVSQWLGEEDEEVMLCAFKGRSIHERFHRQDFFFLNFAMRGDYQALSMRYDRQITVSEGDCYIGQPYSGYALIGDSESDIVIVGVLIRRETFFNEYLSPLSSAPQLLRFFLTPQANRFSDEYVHLRLDDCPTVWSLLGIMLVEYANRTEGTQPILKALIFSLIMMIARTYREQGAMEEPESPTDEMVAWIEGHLSDATLSGLSQSFGYHPNYISSMLHRNTVQTFSQILLEKRMRRAGLLLASTNLSQERISSMVGYRNTSNFYKAFRSYYGMPPSAWRNRGPQAGGGGATSAALS